MFFKTLSGTRHRQRLSTLWYLVMDGEVELERRLVEAANGSDWVGVLRKRLGTGLSQHVVYLVQGSEGFSGLLWGTRLWTSLLRAGAGL